MRILIWHVHGSWTTNFLQGVHSYLIPYVPDRGPDGRGRAATWTWPASAVELSPDELADSAIDVVVVQDQHQLELAEKWLGGRVPGRDIPTVWLEHNAPQGRVNEMRHPAADRDDLLIVHVTHTNALYWDTGTTKSQVIEHGVIDPGRRWTGELLAAGVVVNEPVRRARVTGTDLLGRISAAGSVDVFGIGVDALATTLGHPPWLRTHEDLPQEMLYDRLARCRCYLHPYRWTSLGLALIEAMYLGMPIVALATTEVPRAVTPDCGVVSNDIEELMRAVRQLHEDPERAAEMGSAARARACEHYRLDRFLGEWDELFERL